MSAPPMHHLSSDHLTFIDSDIAEKATTESPRLTGRAAELARAFGLNEPDGSRYGRKLVRSVFLGFEQDDPSKQFVQLTIDNPLSVFKLGVSEAESLATELLEAAAAIRRHAMPAAKGNLNLSGYEIVSHDKSMTVR